MTITMIAAGVFVAFAWIVKGKMWMMADGSTEEEAAAKLEAKMTSRGVEECEE